MLRQTAARGTEREKEGESTKRMKTLAPNGVLEAVGRSRDPRHHVRHNAQMGEEGLGLRHVPGSPLVPRSREILSCTRDDLGGMSGSFLWFRVPGRRFWRL